MRNLKYLSIFIFVSLVLLPECAQAIPNVPTSLGSGNGQAEVLKSGKYVMGFITFSGIVIAAIWGSLGAIKVIKDDDSGWKAIQNASIGAIVLIIIGGVIIGMVN